MCGFLDYKFMTLHYVMMTGYNESITTFVFSLFLIETCLFYP